MSEIAVYGYANADVTARVPRLPGAGERVTAEPIDTRPGGMAANCACAAAWCGGEVAFYGPLGRDAFGAMLEEDLERYGVDASRAPRVASNCKALILVGPDGDRAIVSEPLELHLAPLTARLDADPPPAWLYLDGYHLVAAADLARRARERGVHVWCDLDGAPDSNDLADVLAALGAVDVAQWNGSVAAAFARRSGRPEAEIAGDVAARVGALVSTNGAHAARLTRGGSSVRVPTPAAERVVDTVGAGDVFAGATLAALAAGDDLEDALAGGAEVAARSVAVAGARLPPGERSGR